jgi:hypothetical protein
MAHGQTERGPFTTIARITRPGGGSVLEVSTRVQTIIGEADTDQCKDDDLIAVRLSLGPCKTREPMPEHRIRLRGGWECQYRVGDPEEGLEVVRRVDLPLFWSDDFPARIKLTRQFGRPPVDTRIEEVTLEMRNVLGLSVARLNGCPISNDAGDPTFWSIELPEPLLPRNGLVLEVDLDSARRSPSTWGEISLRIRPR